MQIESQVGHFRTSRPRPQREWSVLADAARALIDVAEASSKAIPGVVTLRRVRMPWIGHEIHADADLDIDIDSTTSLAEAHRRAHCAEHELTLAVPELAGAVVHAYPAGHE